MKRFITLSLALSMMTLINAQKTNVTGTQFAEEEFVTESVWPIGISADGNVTWGYNPVGSLGYYHFDYTENHVTWTEYTDADYYGIKVAGIPYDGRPLVSNYLTSYFFDFDTEEKVYLESPDEFLGVDAWDISADAKYIGCNLTDDEFLVIPMCAEKQEDGTYRMIYLDYDKYDAMGCIAQYTQVRYISEDGQYIMGIQPDNRGMCGRLVVWVRQSDGSYKFTTPLDDYLYDFDCPKPGYTPEWDDYVTADPEKEEDEFNKQMEEFDKAWNDFEIAYDKFTRNRSSIDMYTTNKGTRSNKIYMTFYDFRTEEKGGMATPFIYDCDTEKLTQFTDFDSEVLVHENLPGGGNIIEYNYDLQAIDNDGNIKPFSEWFKEMTDFNFNDIISYGIPYFSEDGKTLMVSGGNTENDAPCTVLKLDRDIFEAVTTGIKVNVVNEVSVAGNKLSIGAGRQGVADVYRLDGSKCGSYTVDGTYDFGGVLANGMYAVKISVNGEKPISMKLIVKY